VLSAGTEHDLDQVYAALGKLKADGLVVTADSIFLTNREMIVGLSARAVVPTIYPFREFIVAGGLVSYGASLPDAYRQAGIYAGRILKGEKPADLPVMHPTKFDLVINLKTAQALGLEVPPLLLARADDVIE
jgi:putative tryptophan/tyrosine transport system substrate-binding protein